MYLGGRNPIPKTFFTIYGYTETVNNPLKPNLSIPGYRDFETQRQSTAEPLLLIICAS